MHCLVTYNCKKEILQVKLYIPHFSFQALYCLVGFGNDSEQVLIDQFEFRASNPDLVKLNGLYFELVYFNCKFICKYVHKASCKY